MDIKLWPYPYAIIASPHMLRNCPKDYLFLFEAILNSKLAEFYLEIKYRLREEGNPEIDVDHINHFPIPDLEFNYNTVKEVIEIAKSLKSPDLHESRRKELQTKLNRLILILYDLDYFDSLQ